MCKTLPMRIGVWSVLTLIVACGSPAQPVVDAGPDVVVDAGTPQFDAGVVDAGTKSDFCVDTFGSVLTNAFGRIDGRLVSIVNPGSTCPGVNSDHVVLEVAIDGGVHRMVVNVMSTVGDPRIYFLSGAFGPLPAPAFADGWHPGVALDYPTSLGVHSDADAGWQYIDMPHAIVQVNDPLTIGAPLSVYGTSSGGDRADSAHLIHRHANHDDGAIVVNPTSSAPTWLLFHFANDQAF